METSESKSTNGNGRKALGRGLEALLPDPATEEVRAGESVAEIGAKFEALDRKRIRREAKRHGWRFWKGA